MSKKNSDQPSNQELVDVSNQVSKTSPSQLMSVLISTLELESNMPPPLSTDLNPSIVLIQDLENEVDDMDTAETEEGKKETVGKKNIIEHARRFRNTAPDKIPPIFVKLKPNIDRYRVVSAARALRKMNDFKGVYINLDRTEAEREFDRNLRESQRLLNRLEEDVTEDGRHRKWFIKRGRVVRGADSAQGVSNRADSAHVISSHQ